MVEKMRKNKDGILIKNPSQIITFDEKENFEIIENKDILIIDDKIEKIGSNLENELDISAFKVIDAEGKSVFPGLVDCHTHFLFAGTREDEYEMKIRGMSYLDIGRKGGGIISTVENIRKASKDELVRNGYKRLNSFVKNGITTVEVKSGYGLDKENELKMLEVAEILNKIHPVDVVSTFLGAHLIPTEYKNNRKKYVDIIINDMIPEIAERKLAEFCDVFLEDSAFNLKETEKILRTGKDFGLVPKIHSEQFNTLGGIRLAVELDAASVDHLDVIEKEDIRILANSNTIGVFLPGAVFFLGLKKYAPARKCIDNGVKYALSTDFNPGSCMTENLILIGTIANTQLRMLPDECIKGITINAAAALKRHNIGNLKEGKKADLTIFNSPNYKYPFYHFGINHIEVVIKDGKIILRDGNLLIKDINNV